MAGEWLPYDLALPTKPETQELVDLSGEGVEVVVYRLLQLWGWASLNSADGTARATPERLARICGGDAQFWRHVAAVGWLVFDEAAGTATIPGWERRFSACAKVRAVHNDRQRRWRGAIEAPRAPQKRLASASRGEEKTVSSSSSRKRCAMAAGAAEAPPAKAVEPEPTRATEPPADWPALQAAWNRGAGAKWLSPTPPDGLDVRLAEPGWLDKAFAAIGRLPRCRYFSDPVILPQLCRPGFVDRVIGGQYDKPKQPRGGLRFDATAPPPRVDPEFEARKAATEARLARERAERDAELGIVDDQAARLDATRRRLAEELTEGVA